MLIFQHGLSVCQVQSGCRWWNDLTMAQGWLPLDKTQGVRKSNCSHEICLCQSIDHPVVVIEIINLILYFTIPPHQMTRLWRHL